MEGPDSISEVNNRTRKEPVNVGGAYIFLALTGFTRFCSFRSLEPWFSLYKATDISRYVRNSYERINSYGT